MECTKKPCASSLCHPLGACAGIWLEECRPKLDGNGNAAYYVGNEIGDDGHACVSELSYGMV